MQLGPVRLTASLAESLFSTAFGFPSVTVFSTKSSHATISLSLDGATGLFIRTTAQD